MAVVWRSLVIQVQVGLVVMMIVCSGHGSMATSIPVPSSTTPATVLTDEILKATSAPESTSQPGKTETTVLTTAAPTVCDEIKTPPNSNFNYSDESPVVNTTVTYTCKAGYEMDGTNTRTCLQNGSWDGAEPNCKLKVCAAIETVANRIISYSNESRIIGTIATYSCIAGYKLMGKNKATCSHNKTWDVTDSQCQLIVCDEIETPTNGNFSYSDESPVVNTTVTYTCNAGYEMDGTNTSTCLQNGSWDGAEPNCKLKVCDTIDIPDNGVVNYSNESRVVNTTATYKCDAGYEMNGTNKRTCTVDGVWDGTDTSCNLTVHGYNDTCIESGPDGQCSTVNAICLIYGDGTGYKCSCTDEDYYHKANYSCLKRPSFPIKIGITTAEITTNKLTISWNGHDDYPDIHVVIDWKSSHDNTIHTFNRTLDSLHNHNVFTDLKSGTKYTFFLYLEKETIRTVLLANVSGYTIPEPVPTMRFGEVWETNFTVVWNTTRPCKNYAISLNSDKHVTIPRTNDTSQRYTFTNLTGGTRYEVIITAEVPGQSSKPISMTSYTRPEPVINVTVTEVLSNTVTLQMTTSPEVQKESYKIYVTPNTSDSVENPITSQNDTKEIGGLESGIEYTFNVYTYYQDLKSEQYRTVSTYTRPMPPDDLTVRDVLEDSLQLNWTLPEAIRFDEYILEYRTVYSEEVHVNVSLNLNKTTAKQHSVQNLTSGTGYVFNLFTVINDLRSNEPATISAFTRPEGPGIPTFKQRFETSIVIEFPSNLSSYNGYQIDGTFYEKGNDTITVTGLNPGTDYMFTIFTVANSTVTSLKNTTFDSFTRPTHPTTANFTDSELHETSLTVTWDAVTNGSVDGYLVYLNNTNSINSTSMSSNESSEITTATFSNLTTGTQYTVNIYSYWRGEESDDSLERTIYTRPTAPRGYIGNVTETTLTLAFDEPVVKWPNYTIEVTSVSNADPRTINVSLDEFPYEIDNLTAGTNYTIKVYSVVDVIVGENALILSSYTKPEAVRPDNITADPSLTTSTSLAIKWALPTEGSVDWYEIQYKCTSPNNPTNMVPSYTNRSNTTTSTVSRLDPGTVCTVNITSYKGNQQGATTQKRIDWSTDENAPDKVQGMNVVAGARNLTVTWNRPLAPNGVIREYRVDVVDVKENCIKSRTIYTCSNCSESSNQQCGQDGSSQVSTPLLCKSANETKLDLETKDVYELLVPNLHPYRNYTVEITPSTRCNGSTTLVSKLTQQAVPTGKPINVNQSMPGTSNTTLSLTWYPPLEEQQNGIITNYTVYIQYNNRTCYNETEGNELYKQMTVESTGGEALNSVAIPDLYPFWVYSIAVSASTVAGEGPNTTEVTMMTNQSPPDIIRSAPINVSKSSSSIGLEWEHPCYVNGIITKYRIHVFSLDDNTIVNFYETQTNETKDIINDLKPFHNYTISVAAINTDSETGPALNTTEVLLTNTGVPLKPTNIRPSAVSNTSLKIQWDRPSLYTGITIYNITAKDVVNSSVEFHASTGWDFSRKEIVVTGLDEYWIYTVTVTAITEAGKNTSAVSNPIRTKEAAPGSVVNLNLTTEKDVTSPRSIQVVWEKPIRRDLNGVLTSYFVKYASGTQGIIVTERIDVNKNNLTISDIKPGPYNVTVFAATSAGNGTIVKEEIIVPAGAPIRKPENGSVPLMKEASAVDVDDDETQIAIELPTDFLCDDSNGQPIQYGLIVTSADHASDEQFVGSKADFDKKIEATYKNWFQIRDMDKPTPYITTPENWLPCQKRRKRDVTVTPKPFTIGAGGECSGIPADQNCNGQLKPATSYRIKSYVCTAGGCSETLYSAPIKTKPGVPVAAIVAGVLAAVAVFLIVIGVVIFLKRRHAACFAKSEEAGTTHARPDTIPGTEMVTATSSSKVFSRPSVRTRQHPVRLSEFPEFVDKMKKDSGLLFSDAYKNLRENSPKHPMARAESQNCRPKNRYTNILPYDHSRVKLLPLDDEDDTDYINASYIPGYTSRREYIATQGPMPATFDDFWRMVWEQNVEIVVMLTKLMEKGRNKCDKYWPDQNEPQFYGDLSVSVMSESNLSDYTIRIMEVKLKDNTRTVKQMSFLKWPDMGCPEYPGLLLDFVKHVRQHQTAQFKDRPMVVHCSAGVGRTGTFIAVDHLLQHIRDHDEVDIYGLVAEMRNNRCNMVQTEDQYIYIHECIREFISNDDVDEDEDDDEHLYANTPTENVYENTGFSNNF